MLVVFTSKEPNVVAHELARAATSMASSHVFSIIPACFKQTIANDMTQAYFLQKELVHYSTSHFMHILSGLSQLLTFLFQKLVF